MESASKEFLGKKLLMKMQRRKNRRRRQKEVCVCTRTHMTTTKEKRQWIWKRSRWDLWEEGKRRGKWCSYNLKTKLLKINRWFPYSLLLATFSHQGLRRQAGFLKILIYLNLILCVWVFHLYVHRLCTMCIRCQQKLGEGIRFSSTAGTDSYDLPCACWESNTDCMEK